jgi:hypothetical protein
MADLGAYVEAVLGATAAGADPSPAVITSERKTGLYVPQC